MVEKVWTAEVIMLISNCVKLQIQLKDPLLFEKLCLDYRKNASVKLEDKQLQWLNKIRHNNDTEKGIRIKV